MCRMASFIVTRTKVLWSVRSDSHEDIISEHHLRDDMHGDNFVRVELCPPYDDYRLPINQWIYRTDQDSTPDWYDPRGAEIAVRSEMPKWMKVKIINDPKAKINVKCKMSRIVLAGKVIQSGGECLLYGSSSNKQSGGKCYMYDSSSNKQSGGTCCLIGSSSNKQSRGKCYMYDSSSNEQWGGKCYMYDSSKNTQSGGSCDMYDISSNEQSGGKCWMYGSSINEQSGGDCYVYGPNCRLTKVSNNVQ